MSISSISSGSALTGAPYLAVNQTSAAQTPSQVAETSDQATTSPIAPLNPSTSPINIPPLAPTNPLGAPVWGNSPDDPVSQVMGGDFLATTLAGRFAGLGAALLTRFKTTTDNFSQWEIIPPPTAGQPPPNAGSKPFDSSISGNIVLNVTTVSGVKVEVDISSLGNLAVQVTSSGSLTNKEQLALANLAKGFQAAIDGMTASTPTIDISGLTQFDPTVLSSVNLSIQLQSNSAPMTLDFQANSTQRSVNATMAGGSIGVNVNLTDSAVIGTAAQQAKAISNYVQQFTQEASRDPNADPTLMVMFTAGFTQINSNYPPANPLAFNSSPTVRTAQDHAMLTGLADFQASVTEAPTSPNPLRLDEVDHFSYEASQITSITGPSYPNRVITQLQQSSLSASYHKSLTPSVPLQLTTNKESQNYYYEQIDDNSSASTTIGYTKKVLSQASIAKSASQTNHESKYVQAALVADTVTPESASNTKDLMGLLAPYQSQLPQDAAKWAQVLAAINNEVYLQSDPIQLAGCM